MISYIHMYMFVYLIRYEWTDINTCACRYTKHENTIEVPDFSKMRNLTFGEYGT